MPTVKSASVPAKRLSATVSPSSLGFKLNNIKDWDGATDLTSVRWGTLAYGAFTNPDRTRLEFFSFDPATIADETILFVKRGLKYDGDYDTEVPANKQTWIARQTVVLIGTDASALLGHFVTDVGDQTIDDVKTFLESPIVPTPTSGEMDAAASVEFVLDIAFAGAPDGSEVQKGVFEAATTSEVAAGDDSGTTTAPTVVRPSKLAEVIQNGSYLYAVEDGAGSDDAYSLALVPTPTGTLPDGAVIFTKITVANAGACTLNPNGQGAGPIKKYVLGAIADLETGDIVANMPCFFMKQGANFVLMNPGASGLSNAILALVSSFFGTTKTQGNKVTFTAGEDLADADIVAVTSADGVKRFSPTALPATDTFTTNDTLTSTYANGNDAKICQVLRLSDSLAVGLANINESGGGSACNQFCMPFTASTGVFGNPTKGAATGITSPLGYNVSKVSATHALFTSWKNNSILSCVTDLSSGISSGIDVTVDNSNCSECWGHYVSDSHVLYVYRDTSNASIVFAKYTRSGTALSSSTTGTITTLVGVTFTLKLVERFEGTDDFLIVIQNQTAGVAQAAIATYNQGTSSFTIGAWTDFDSGSDLSTSVEQVGVAAVLSATQMMIACGTSTTEGLMLLATKSGTTVTLSVPQGMQTRTANSQFSLTMFNSRVALLVCVNGTSMNCRLLELNAAGTDIVIRVSQAITSLSGSRGVESGLMAYGFRVNPKKMALATIVNSGDDYGVGSGSYTLPEPIGSVDSAIGSGSPVDVVTGGYADGFAGLTAGLKYYADIGGLLTTDNNGTPIKIGVAKDTNEMILSVSGT